MKKNLFTLFMLVFSVSLIAQVEKHPVFNECSEVQISELETCFNNQVKQLVSKEFKLPKQLQEDGFSETLNIVFLVTSEGKFKSLYVNSPYKELKEEIQRVFETFPTIKAASYNNHPVEMQFVFPLKIPLNEVEPFVASKKDEVIVKVEKKKETIKLEDEVKLVDSSKKLLFPEHTSKLSIPFTHAEYSVYDRYLDQAENLHTSVKPYVYEEVNKYYNLTEAKSKFIKDKKSWFGRKLWNEHLVNVQGNDFWFTVDAGIDVQAGRDSEDVNTFNNTRSVHINGGIAKNVNFSASFFESQGRFANYVNNYAESIRPDGGNPAIIPGRGTAKDIYTAAYDYPVSDAYITYSPSKHFNFNFGYGKNFIGDGYRSLFLSDATSPYTYFKMTTKFWKFNYTNIWMSLQDVRPELVVDGAHKTKYLAMHYLSWNVTKKLNLGFFEAVLWDNVNDRGFDVNYLNPLIFYTSVEFSTGSRAGNTLLGLSGKYKLNKNISLYGQLLLDELRPSELTSSEGWWANKYGIQLGAKYYNAFGVENLYLQGEFNQVRPYTYSHDEANYNFGHYNQPLAHLWGGNFREVIGIARYTKDRWYANAKLLVGKKGFDFNNGTDTYSYGGNVFADNDNRLSDYGNEIGQGNTADIFIGDLQVGYLINPAINLKLFGGVNYRSFSPIEPTESFTDSNSTWITFGLKTDLFNWYFDY